MKLSITQMALGILIIVTACFIVHWMIFGVVSLLNIKVLDKSGVIVSDYFPENETLFTIARYSSVLLLGLGLAVLFTGAFWKRVKNKRKLAITQIIAGALIVTVSIYILIWGYALEYIIPIEGGPVLVMARTIGITILTALFGLAVVGCGTGQFIKTRRE